MSKLTRRNRNHKKEEGTVEMNATIVAKKFRSVRCSTWSVKVGMLIALVIVGKILSSTHNGGPSYLRNVIDRRLGSGMTLRLQLNDTFNERSIGEEAYGTNLGPHEFTVSVRTTCRNPRVWLRFTGDALVHIPLDRSADGLLHSLFCFPFAGSYFLDVKFGCEGNSTFVSLLSAPLDLTVQESAQQEVDCKDRKSSYYWTSTSRVASKVDVASTPTYIWKMSPFTQTAVLHASSSLGSSVVSKDATPVPNKFKELSNYEIVCWIGSESAAVFREAFLSLRPQIANNQRPFKFHYHNVTNFLNPDQHWQGDEPQRFRKCKIVFVSIDELDSKLSREEYKIQLKTFLSHIVTALNDDTFPVWMTTLNFSPTAGKSMCHAATEGLHETHPCNSVLFEMFQNESSLPQSVHLMDNTDLLSPMFDDGRKDVVAVVALRMFAIIGKQVDAWRKDGQKGTKEGLLRGSILEPNKELVRYEWK